MSVVPFVQRIPCGKMKKVIAFGEILWDIFGDDKKMGGAPLNFSAHYAKLGGNIKLVSAVGNDENGAEAIKCAGAFGIDTEYISVVDKPTGQCIVLLDENGSPTYEIVPDASNDCIQPVDILGGCDALYYGSLACRSAVSKASLMYMLKQNNAKEYFFDVNIRQNYYTSELLDELMSYATILKVSREEIHVFGSGSEKEICDRLFSKFDGLKMIAVTLDADGAFLYRRGLEPMYSHKPNGKVVSTVGGGDSFAACLLYSLLNGDDDRTALKKAVTLSDYVVTKKEAVPQYTQQVFREINGRSDACQ